MYWFQIPGYTYIKWSKNRKGSPAHFIQTLSARNCISFSIIWLLFATSKKGAKKSIREKKRDRHLHDRVFLLTNWLIMRTTYHAREQMTTYRPGTTHLNDSTIVSLFVSYDGAQMYARCRSQIFSGYFGMTRYESRFQSSSIRALCVLQPCIPANDDDGDVDDNGRQRRQQRR